MKYAHKILLGKHIEKRPLGRYRCKWKDNKLLKLFENKYGESAKTGFI
jgi:hypothetical protein